MLATFKSTAISALLAFAIAGSAGAETTVSMDVLHEVEVTQADGTTKTKLEPIETAIPGEILIYRITLKNTDPVPATSVGLTLPVDANLLIDPASLSGTDDFDVLFSVDGGTTFGQFENLTVVENGARRSATPADLTHVSIGIEEISAQSETSIKYSAVIE